jgi:AraC-like DNA-binding protein
MVVLKSSVRSPRIVNDADFRRVCLARDFIHASHTCTLRLGDVARKAGMSKFHFARLFRRATGETPHAYLTRIRLENAKRILARGGSVTEACFEVGFSSLGSFSALFARDVGVAPSGYARRIRVLASVPNGLLHALVPACFALRFGGG